jgi:radical SAM superfamily enzyme YgiQ (UPF0313 family)
MRICLINPADRTESYSSMPLGLAYISSGLKKNGFDVKGVDFCVTDKPLEEIVSEIADYKPDLVGISVTTPYYKSALAIAGLIKSIHNTPVVFGGIHPSLLPGECIKNKSVDFVITGEGENSFTALALFLLKKRGRLEEIKGLYYKKNGKVFSTGEPELTENLDDLPFPDMDIFAFKKYKQPLGHTDSFMTLMTSRGCPFNCTYCVNSTNALFGRRYRYHSVERVMSEIEHVLKKYRVKEIIFYDDNFSFNRERLIRICDEIIRRGLKFKWKCSSRVESLDHELLKKMRSAGCYLIAFGVESGSPEIIRSLRRNPDLKQIEGMFRLCRKAGIKTLAYFIIGFPEDSRETIKQTVDFAIRLNPAYVQFALMNPYPGTKIYEEYRDKKLFADDSGYYCYVGENANTPVRTVYMTREELLSEYKSAIRRFYFRPRYIAQTLASSLNLTGVKRLYYGLTFIIKSAK